MAESKPGRGSDQFPLRLPDGMRDRIKKAADNNNRSMNAEIIDALEQHFPAIDDDIEIAYQKMTSALSHMRSKEAEGSLSHSLLEALTLTVEGIMFDLRREKDSQRKAAYINSLMQMSMSVSLALQASSDETALDLTKPVENRRRELGGLAKAMRAKEDADKLIKGTRRVDLSTEDEPVRRELPKKFTRKVDLSDD